MVGSSVKFTLAVCGSTRFPSVTSVAVKVTDSATVSLAVKVTWPLASVTSGVGPLMVA